MTDTTQPHPDPQEASSLPVVESQYLTIVYRTTPGDHARAILEAFPWSVAGWSHAIDERDLAQSQLTALRAEVAEAYRQRDAEREARYELAGYRQEQALQYLSDNRQWIEETGRLRAEIDALRAALEARKT